jgi:hypothetical protein
LDLAILIPVEVGEIELTTEIMKRTNDGNGLQARQKRRNEPRANGRRNSVERVIDSMDNPPHLRSHLIC